MTPSTENVQKVADVLQVSVDYLLGNTDNPNPDNEGSKPVDLSDKHLYLSRTACSPRRLGNHSSYFGTTQ